MKKNILLLILTLLFLLIGCTKTEETSNNFQNEDNSTSSLNEEFESSQILSEIYNIPSQDYIIYESKMLDTYFIACALYFNFESETIVPNPENTDLYTEIKNYFMPYKNHEFIKNLDSYVNVQNKCENNSVVFSFLMYGFSKNDYKMGVNEIQTDVFENGEEFNSFLNMLYKFYKDTNADQFFKITKANDNMKDYIKENIKNVPVELLLNEMETYVNNKNNLYPEQNIKYRSIITMIRPFNASFYTIQMNNNIYLTGQQSPSGSFESPEILDINQMINTTVHEFLHNYINQPVYEQNTLITELSQEKNKTDYTNGMYAAMEWHRIVDESIVRVVETAIYKNVYKDSQKAFNEILKKEIEYGGMFQLEKMYNTLNEYENNRSKYTKIDDFIPELIKIMFS